jgi:hypothetical protein
MMIVPIEGSGKRPVVLNNLVVTPTQKGFVAAVIMRLAEAGLV